MAQKLHKATEVCQVARIQPYVLRSWEKEFPRIGLKKSEDGPRLYRQADIQQVLRIKELVFSEGLTLAGARRRLEGESEESPLMSVPAATEVTHPRGQDVPAEVTEVREGLRSLLEMLEVGTGKTTKTSRPKSSSKQSAKQSSARSSGKKSPRTAKRTSTKTKAVKRKRRTSRR